MKDFLITGINSGLGKHLYNNLPNSLGLNRDNFDSIKDESYQTIIHCAFNKENIITDYKKYLDDNILLTQRLKNLKYNKFIYISTIDVYQEYHNMYSFFKKFSETLLDDKDLILRCSMMLGPTMKPNHLTKIKSNIDHISLSKDSTFNYILMDDLVEFFISNDYLGYSGVIDFVSNSNITLNELKQIINSTTQLGEYTYKSNLEFTNPIYKLNNKYNKTSINNLKKYERFL
jgi:hypothetical protein